VTDAAVTCLGSHAVSIMLGSSVAGRTEFTWSQTVRVGSNPVWIDDGDFDGDGDVDLAVANSTPSTFTVLINDLSGSGTFKSYDYPTDARLDVLTIDPTGLVCLRVNDFNNDDKLDIALLENTVSSKGVQPAIEVFVGDGAGLFSALTTSFGNNIYAPARCLAYGDLDGKDGTDLVIGYSSGHYISVAFNNGNGDF
jgi:hypothetical protein